MVIVQEPDSASAACMQLTKHWQVYASAVLWLQHSSLDIVMSLACLVQDC